MSGVAPLRFLEFTEAPASISNLAASSSSLAGTKKRGHNKVKHLATKRCGQQRVNHYTFQAVLTCMHTGAEVCRHLHPTNREQLQMISYRAVTMTSTSTSRWLLPAASNTEHQTDCNFKLVDTLAGDTIYTNQAANMSCRQVSTFNISTVRPDNQLKDNFHFGTQRVNQH